MLFEYKAINKAGQTYTSTAEAADKQALASMLKGKGEVVISVDEKEKKDSKKGGATMEKINAALSRVKDRDKIIFTRNLAAMIDGGLTISRGLEVLERQTRNVKFKRTLAAIRETVQQGSTLSAALREYPKIFSPLFASMVEAGEESGNLTASLENLGMQLEKARQLKKRIRGAMMYPTIVIIAMIIVGILMLIFVVPTLTSTFVELNVELPRSTQAIIAVSDFLKNNTFISLGLIIVVIISFGAALKNKKGRRAFEFFILHVPLIKDLVKETNAARTARTLSSLLASGVEVVNALGITKDVLQNSYYKDVIAQAEETIQKGRPIAETFGQHENLYPVLVGEMVSVGEETGNLPDMLERIAVFYEGEVDQKTKDMSTIIEPFLMVVIGAVVGFFAVSMISPIYSLSSGI